MSSNSAYRDISFGSRTTPAVKWLIIANVAFFAVEILLTIFDRTQKLTNMFLSFFALTPSVAILKLHVWQFVTYSFLHELAGAFPLHILMNMFMLWVFGVDIENALGTRRFLILYFASALVGGIAMIPLFNSTVWGASGAVFGVMALYARMFPDRRLLIWGVIPVRARPLIFFLVAIELLYVIGFGGQTNVAHLAHLGGFVTGWFFFWGEKQWLAHQRKVEADKSQRLIKEDAEMRRRVDEILAKVAREGIGSLTKAERDFLDEASRRFKR